MLPDRVSNPGPLTYGSGALLTALRGPAPNFKTEMPMLHYRVDKDQGLFVQNIVGSMKLFVKGSVLHIRRGKRGNLGIISILLLYNIFCDPSLEPFCADGSNEGSQHMFLLRNNKILSLNYPQYTHLSGALRSCYFFFFFCLQAHRK